MSELTPETTEEEEIIPPKGNFKIIYLGPTSPHWEFRSDFGEKSLLEIFQKRAESRLLLLPPHDPQFQRNRERINRDAEREHLLIEWDLGYEEDEEDYYR